MRGRGSRKDFRKGGGAMKMVKGWSVVFSLFVGAGVLAGPAPAVADPVESGFRKDVEEHRSALA